MRVIIILTALIGVSATAQTNDYFERQRNNQNMDTPQYLHNDAPVVIIQQAPSMPTNYGNSPNDNYYQRSTNGYSQ